MAVTAIPRRSKDPEGRMPLRAHLVELRRRFFFSAIAVTLGAVVAWLYIYDPLLIGLSKPLKEVAAENGTLASLNFGQVGASFNLKVKLSIYIGIVVSSPVWLYQLWAFIMPGLKRKEKRYALGFVAAALPLFLGGIALAWVVLPNAVHFLVDFAPTDTTSLVDAQDYLTFASRLVLVFGCAFVVPLLLVALNLAGVVSGMALAKAWRIAVFVTFLFAAVASPSPDAGSMLILAFSLVGLYVLAVLISLLVDRRRRRRRAADPVAATPDDEASPLEDDPWPLEESPSPRDGA